MEFIQTIEQLEFLYGHVSEAAKRKCSNNLTPLYAKWISA
mgnify:CR=1 FL=1